MKLFGHPFSSYTWKALIPLREKHVPFEFSELGDEFPENFAEFAERSPTGKFPLLVDGDRIIFEATAIIEYLDVVRPEPRLIPDGLAGVDVRMLDRMFDNYVMSPAQAFVTVRMGLAPESGTEQSRATLDRSYAWLDANLGREWATGDYCSLADCAAAPSLFYADWVYPIPDSLRNLRAYRARLLARPTIARAV